MSRAGHTYCLRGEIAGLDQVFVLEPGENRLGALESNEVVLPLAGVSRVHARLEVHEERLRVEDLDSKNGTFVEGRRVQSGAVDPGGEVRFGPVGLRFEEFHQEDGELAIRFEDSAEPTASFPIQEQPLKTGTHVSSISRQWLVLAEAFQDRLLHGPDLTGALRVLHEELHLESACVVEMPEDGDPIVLNSAGHMEDSGALRRLLEPLREKPLGEQTPSPDVRFETLHDEEGRALTFGAVRPAAGEALALALWGKFPGRRDSELLVRLLLRMLEATLRDAGDDAPEGTPEDYPGLVVPPDYVYGRSEAMRKIYELMQTLAQGDLPVLIIGETGVGKEYLAKILHDSSPRRRGPFVAINCAAIPSELLEAELFGIGEGVATGVSARKGRFQIADGGTLFLDEIGDMSSDLQAKLLRALQEKEVHPVGLSPVQVDVRVLGATNQELTRRIHQGSFRADLYYRLAGYVLEIPPLRERKEDIPPLVEHFLRSCADELRRSIRGLTVRALRMLTEYPWPGNVRELANEVRRAVYLCPDRRPIESATLSKNMRQYFEENALQDNELSDEPESPAAALPSAGGSAPSGPGATPDAGDAATDSAGADRLPIALGFDSLDLEELEGRAVREALRRCDGNQVQAAKLLGITRQTLRRRMKKLGELPAQKKRREKAGKETSDDTEVDAAEAASDA